MSGIQILPSRLTDDSTGTLASITAIILDSVLGTGLLSNFLLKKLRTQIMVEGLTAGEGLILFYASTTLTIAEIANIMNASILGPAEIDEQASAKGIYWETLRMVNAEQPLYQLDLSLGGGKGIPIFEGVGMQLVAYNPAGGTLTTAGVISGIQAAYGVWM